MGGINDDEVPCCSKDVKREDESLLQKFVPIHVFSNATVMMMKGHCSSSKRVTTHQCNQCDYQTKWRSHLEIHARRHTGEKTYQCDLCQKKFSTKSNLNKHILTHKDIRRFQCDLCEYKATAKLDLARHLLTHTGENPLPAQSVTTKQLVKQALIYT